MLKFSTKQRFRFTILQYFRIVGACWSPELVPIANQLLKIALFLLDELCSRVCIFQIGPSVVSCNSFGIGSHVMERFLNETLMYDVMPRRSAPARGPLMPFLMVDLLN
jgi:hypothetical protein